jgi:hypothetical protein
MFSGMQVITNLEVSYDAENISSVMVLLFAWNISEGMS